MTIDVGDQVKVMQREIRGAVIEIFHRDCGASHASVAVIQRNDQGRYVDLIGNLEKLG